MILNVVGARPNFVKMAPVVKEMIRRGMPQVLVHTGQHYDREMSDLFFRDLEFPAPDMNLGVGSGTHAAQTAKILESFEPVCIKVKPRLVLVAGDVNSTIACALAAAKLHIPVAHLEAGLRSFDRGMPEEINRILTDHLAELLFTTEPSGKKHLNAEGIGDSKIHFVGNTMIDSLREFLARSLAREPWKAKGLEEKKYGLVTLHRPENLEDASKLSGIHAALEETGKILPLIFPMHPRTKARFAELNMRWTHVKICEPLGYLDFLGMMARARLVLTDSGGIQEETTALGVPCLTLRGNTERPVTIEEGTNRVIGTDPARIAEEVRSALNGGQRKEARVPSLWDGKAAARVADVIQAWKAAS
ncbi:MAG TPA: UDP-N-acetylglucosamine 2-epimerase (non-hydrolyzing) [Verrucomicrobiae bacterium]|nr:UDP-N-acetylglucosamine 2-epimerase (non-hydrolyzing) [Verrucomicrobiae bacterium]